MEITVDVCAKVGDEVFVPNYRTKDHRIEAGMVSGVNIRVDNNWKTTVYFDVRLQRKTFRKDGPSWGRPISLCVTQDKIILPE